jgi:hypothetical protein
VSPRRRRSAASTRRSPAVSLERRVTVYHAEGCHRCDRAIEVAREAQAEGQFALELVDIGGVASLEAEYRAHLPVIEIDGVRAFTYFVSVDALLARLRGDGSREL